MNKYISFFHLSLLAIIFSLSGCTSYEKFKKVTQEVEFPSQVYNADFNQGWQAVIEVMKRFDIATQSQEAGLIKTRWMDNTRSFNFANSFNQNESVRAAQFKLQVNVVKGFRGDREVTKITFYKRQLVEQDFLQGWKESPSDNIMEKTLLYRIGRILHIEQRLDKIQKEREKEQIESF